MSLPDDAPQFPAPTVFRRLSPAISLAAALAGVFLSACEKEKTAGLTGEDPRAFGEIFTQEGEPARGARVRFCPVGFLPPKPSAAGLAILEDSIRESSTNDLGRYRLPAGLTSGRYNLFVEAGSLRSFRDSVFLSDRLSVLPSDTLRPPGFLLGEVQVQAHHSAAYAEMLLPGTPRRVVADASGRFRLGPLAPGNYRLVLMLSSPEYAPLSTTFTVVQGVEATLKEPLKPAYLGVPLVTGLRASMDTAAGMARLQWSAVSYPGFREYLVYRDRAGSDTLSEIPIGRTRDTLFLDTLYGEDPGVRPFSPADSLVHRLVYRVRVAGADSLGAAFNRAEIAAAPSGAVKTEARLRSLPDPAGNSGDTLSIKDTVRLEVSYRNPGRAIRRIEWLAGDSTIETRILPGSKEGRDTFRFVLSDVPGSTAFHARIFDDAGAMEERWKPVLVLRDSPRIAARPDSLVILHSRVDLHATIQQRFGTIAKWEWDIGGSGIFRATSRADTSIILAKADSAYRCVVRATDDDGNAVLDTVLFTVLPVHIKTPMPRVRHGFAMAATGGKAYLIGGPDQGSIASITMDEYDFATDSWRKRANLVESREMAAACVFGNRIFVFGGHRRGDNPASVLTSVIEYDLSGDSWRQRAPLPEGVAFHRAQAWDSAIYVVGDKVVPFGDPIMYYYIMVICRYTPSLDTWTVLEYQTHNSGTLMGIVDGTLYLAMRENRGASAGPLDRVLSRQDSPHNLVKTYDPASRVLALKGPIPQLSSNQVYAVSGTRIFMFGGRASTPVYHSPNIPTYNSLSTVHVFDVGTGSWMKALPTWVRRSHAGAVVDGHTILLMGGMTEASALNVVEEYFPP